MRTFTTSLCLILVVWMVDVASEKSRIRQKRAWIITSFDIEEEYQGNFPYLVGRVDVDWKLMANFMIDGKGVDEEPRGIFSIDKNTAEMFVHKRIDFESHQRFLLKFYATNKTTGRVNTELGMEINILDINDHAPQFSRALYETHRMESTSQGETLVTVYASDDDDSSTCNGTFSFRIISVYPETTNAEFYIDQTKNSQHGAISFKGCLDYEEAQKYTILVEAKDHGDKVQLSSTSTVLVNVIDKNNHLPEILGQTGPGKIKEREMGVEVLRIQVTDKDSHGSPAWKAKYTIHGDKGEYFKIETDPETNEGILTVQKLIEYNEVTEKNISISVENVEPYLSCRVRKRVKDSKWDVETSIKETRPKLYPVTITVDDVNDPPIFIPAVKHVEVMENPGVGFLLETFTAKDMDRINSNTFRFLKGHDPADWVTVDSKTGRVVTAKVLDRESSFVNNSTYIVTLYAVDYGEPPMTGTGTLIIHIKDQNDNVPVLSENKLNMCLSDEPIRTKLSAVDPDLPPYSGPFLFELIGDVEGKWRIDPSYGTTVDLIKDSTVYAGHHELLVRVSDNQGHESLQNLSVTVCDCSETPTCHIRRSSTSKMGGGSVGIIILALLMLLVFMFMAILTSCEKKVYTTEDGPGMHLLISNIEEPGTDCGVSRDSKYDHNKASKLHILRGPGEELGDYAPHVYAEEGESVPDAHLDVISIPESDFGSVKLRYLGQRFNTLASICRADVTGKK
ncbi:cadherin-like protein 26 [Chanos chanos]|uniref:Cadherin-like protein 26 n=1 Tax=Chanos chanos TaxID=29144 RepID=A0A6J2UVC4_CHACN|nr:cadherin-like protein 26 [Chanos chanos]